MSFESIRITWSYIWYIIHLLKFIFHFIMEKIESKLKSLLKTMQVTIHISRRVKNMRNVEICKINTWNSSITIHILKDKTKSQRLTSFGIMLNI